MTHRTAKTVVVSISDCDMGFACVAVWCSALQCVAVCCSVLECVAVCCSVLIRSQSVIWVSPVCDRILLKCVLQYIVA